MTEKKYLGMELTYCETHNTAMKSCIVCEALAAQAKEIFGEAIEKFTLACRPYDFVTVRKKKLSYEDVIEILQELKAKWVKE